MIGLVVQSPWSLVLGRSSSIHCPRSSVLRRPQSRVGDRELTETAEWGTAVSDPILLMNSFDVTAHDRDRCSDLSEIKAATMEPTSADEPTTKDSGLRGVDRGPGTKDEGPRTKDSRVEHVLYSAEVTASGTETHVFRPFPSVEVHN